MTTPPRRAAYGAAPGWPRAVGKQAEPVVQLVHETIDGDAADPSRGQFQGQRNAVEPPADLGHRRRQGHLRAHLPSAVQEQPHRVEPVQGGGVGCLRRDRQRRHTPGRLPFHAQGMSAGGEHADQPCALQDRGDELGDTLNDVLAVVQQQERRAVAEVIDDGARLTRLQTERARHPSGHKRTVGERRQLDPPHAARKALRPAHCDLPGQPGLAAAARARKRHQPRFAEQPGAAAEVVGSSHERAQLGRQVARHPQPDMPGHPLRPGHTRPPLWVGGRTHATNRHANTPAGSQRAVRRCSADGHSWQCLTPSSAKHTRMAMTTVSPSLPQRARAQPRHGIGHSDPLAGSDHSGTVISS